MALGSAGLGLSVNVMVKQINQFMRQNNALMVLRLTHIANAEDGRAMEIEQ